MSKADKLLARFLSKPKDFTFDELRRLLVGFGCEEARSGKTGGSRAAFVNRKKKSIIRLHRPHPNPVLKEYQMNDVAEGLRMAGVIK